jgi:hypothetical protein
MWEPQPLATLRASTACTGITLPFYLLPIRKCPWTKHGGAFPKVRICLSSVLAPMQRITRDKDRLTEDTCSPTLQQDKLWAEFAFNRATRSTDKRVLRGRDFVGCLINNSIAAQLLLEGLTQDTLPCHWYQKYKTYQYSFIYIYIVTWLASDGCRLQCDAMI